MATPIARSIHEQETTATSVAQQVAIVRTNTQEETAAHAHQIIEVPPAGHPHQEAHTRVVAGHLRQEVATRAVAGHLHQEVAIQAAVGHPLREAATRAVAGHQAVAHRVAEDKSTSTNSLSNNNNSTTTNKQIQL